MSDWIADGLRTENARLRETVAEMVEALEHAREKMWTYGFSEDDLQPIRAALAKAQVQS